MELFKLILYVKRLLTHIAPPTQVKKEMGTNMSTCWEGKTDSFVQEE